MPVQNSNFKMSAHPDLDKYLSTSNPYPTTSNFQKNNAKENGFTDLPTLFFLDRFRKQTISFFRHKALGWILLRGTGTGISFQKVLYCTISFLKGTY